MGVQNSLLSTEDLSRVYALGADTIFAVRDVNMQVHAGQFIAVIGRSGSGKTTLLNLLAGLDRPTTGRVLLEGRDLSEMNEAELTSVRRHKIGFVFQSFGLLPLLSAYENVELPLRIASVGGSEREHRTSEALEIVGLLTRSRHRPYELSGGEQQRVAIARAIVTRPPLVIADEPTGELDSVNARAIFGLFKEMVQKRGISVVAATHDSTLLAMADEVKEMKNGSLLEDASSGLRYRD